MNSHDSDALTTMPHTHSHTDRSWQTTVYHNEHH